MNNTASRSLPSLVCLILLTACSPNIQSGTTAEPEKSDWSPMTVTRLGKLIKEIDSSAELTGSTWRFEAAGTVVAVIYDENVDRMRIMIPITETKDLTEAEKTRLLQANFDSALDARYAIAQNLVWGTYIHPLSPLTDSEFLVGLGQTISVVETYGDTYSSGMFIFGAGDSNEIQRKRILDLLRKQET